MSLRRLAESDLKYILSDSSSGGAVDFVISKPSGEGYPVSGFVGDIGYLLDTEGNPVAGRTCTASYRMADLSDKGDYIIPGKGWRVIYSDLTGHEWILGVTRAEPDRTVGIMRLILSLDLSKKDVNRGGV